MNRLKRDRISKIVSDLLLKCSIKKLPIDVEEIARVLNIEIKKSPYDGEKGVSGVLIRDSSKNIIGVNTTDNEHRQRFTMAHEIGHFLLHAGNQIYVDRKYNVNFRDKKSGEGTDNEEIEANTFASMLLIPDNFLLKDLRKNDTDILNTKDIKFLADRYNVSPEAMSLRLSRVNFF